MNTAGTFRPIRPLDACGSVLGLPLSAQLPTSSSRRERAFGYDSRFPKCDERSLRKCRYRTSGHLSLPENAKVLHRSIDRRTRTQDTKKPAPVKLVSGPSRVDPRSLNLWHGYFDYTRSPFRQHMPCETTTTTQCQGAPVIHDCY